MLDWDSLYKSGKDFGRPPAQVLESILSHVQQNMPKTALDIGCGTGWLTRELSARGYRVWGIDTSSEAVRIAASQADNIEYQVTGLLTSPFLSGSFGLITCKHVYAFIPDKPAFLAKVSELLAPSGTFVLITPLLETYPEKPAIAVDGAELRRVLGEHFEIVVDRPLVAGQLLLLRAKP